MEPCKYANLDELAQSCATCQKCALGETRTKLVFGVGNPNADLMFVGEAPGEQEDLTGTPFVGRAGQLLDKFLYAVDIERKDVYIANILKCRPPKNRDPLPQEEDACIDYLREQVRLIQPKVRSLFASAALPLCASSSPILRFRWSTARGLRRVTIS